MQRKTVILVIVLSLIITIYSWFIFGDKVPVPGSNLVPAITKDTIGFKQNNPGNIRNSNDVFKGEVKTSNSFKAFETMDLGYRAIAKILYTYYNRGINTIEKIISIYAPSSENNTDQYIKFVSNYSGISPTYELKKSDFEKGLFSNSKVEKIIAGISQQEISFVNYTALNKGYNDFLKQIA